MAERRVVLQIDTDRHGEMWNFYAGVLGLDLPGDLALGAAPNGTRPRMTLTVEVADVDAVHRRACEWGMHVTRPPATDDGGVRSFSAVDPSGTFVQVRAAG